MKYLGITLAVFGFLMIAGGILGQVASMNDEFSRHEDNALRWWLTTHTLVPGIVVFIIGAVLFFKNKNRISQKELSAREPQLKGFKRFE